jgi:quercetin dioxygenase-like cupin family protein
MKTRLLITSIAAVCVAFAAFAQDNPNRKEAKRTDLSGAPGMEVISSIVEYKKGETAKPHFHHGVEVAYVLQGTQILPLGANVAAMLEAGTVVNNLRDVVHGGFTVTGDTPLKLFIVHIVDKGKPLYAEPKK